jgi:hypothetical protein
MISISAILIIVKRQTIINNIDHCETSIEQYYRYIDYSIRKVSSISAILIFVRGQVSSISGILIIVKRQVSSISAILIIV